MLKRDQLEAMLGQITDDEVGAIWRGFRQYRQDSHR